MNTLPDKIVFFDGVCVMCNSSVQFILKHNKAKDIYFASLQSDIAKTILTDYHIDTNQLSTVLYKHGNYIYTKSEAALQICKHLSLPYRLLYYFKIMPTSWRNAVYDFIARNRYKWFGKYDACTLPTIENKHRYL